MAEEIDPKKILRAARQRMIEGIRAKVRYGRSTLTVRTSVAVLDSPIEEALKRYRREEIDAEEVAWRFLREQAITHSPTFGWSQVELEKLLPRVVAVTREPNLTAQSPDELVIELEKIEQMQLKARKQLSESIQRLTSSPTADYLKTVRGISRDLNAFAKQHQFLQGQSKFIQQALRPTQEQWIRSNQSQIEQIRKAFRPMVDTSFFSLTQERMREMLGLKLPKNFAGLQGTNNPFLKQDWRPVFERVAEAAREADVPEVADAVEATANEAQKEDSDVDLAAVIEAIEGLREQVEESNRLNAEREEPDRASAKKGESFKHRVVAEAAWFAIRWLLDLLLIELGLSGLLELSGDPAPAEEAPDAQPLEPDSDSPDAGPPPELA